jgi:hypothetical protein
LQKLSHKKETSTMTIQKYFDSGYHCIPIQRRSKARLSLGGLSNLELSKNGITEEQATEWDKLYPINKGYGVGVLCGEASGIIGADVDSDDKELLALMPPTPAIKVGAKGATFFYKYEDRFSSKIFIRPQSSSGVKGAEQIEILTNGQYTILPPSIHATTGKPYYWKAEELWLLAPNELPSFDEQSIEKIHKYFAKKYGEDFTDAIDMGVDLHGGPWPSATENGVKRSAHGSHNRLKKFAANLLALDTPAFEAALSLVKYDVENHLDLPYFKDRTRGKDSSSPDPVQNAKSFYERIAASVNKKRLAEGMDAHVISEIRPLFEPTANEAPQDYLDPHKGREKSLPAITGAMKDFVEYLNKASISENTEVYLGASLAWLSMLVASRFAVKTKAFTTPANLMLWGVMPSGVGKDAPQSLLQELLYPYNILGATNYKSAPALVMNLRNIFKETKSKEPELLRKAQRENLVVIDECSALFRIMAKGESYQQDMVETLNTLFSRSSGYYAGDQSIERGMKYGAAFNPYFTLLGFTTYDHFTSIDGTRIIGNGFFERSLVFIKNKKSPFNKNPERDSALFDKLKSFTDKYLSTPVNLVDFGEYVAPEKEITTEVAYTEFPISSQAEDALHDYRKAMYEKQGEDIDEAFFNRFGEIATKLALLHAVSDNAEEIGVSDVEWAIQVVEWCYATAWASLNRMKAGGEDLYSEAVSRIEKYLAKKPHRKAARSEVLRNVRFGPKSGSKSRFLTELIEMKILKSEAIDGVAFLSATKQKSITH